MKSASVLGSLLLISSFCLGSAFAGIEQAPPAFPYAGGEAIFVDFESADYSITYDLTKKTANVSSEIIFNSLTSGYPIFDLVPNPTEMTLDGAPVTSTVTPDPDGVTKLRVVNSLIPAGRHVMTIKHVMTDGVSFRPEGVASAFWFSDLDDRQYLEMFLPSNLEFDQVPMKMRIEVLGADGKPHILRANGDVKTISENVFEVEFPKFYTTSSMFFHLLPVNAVPSTQFTYTSIDGRSIPVDVYTKSSLKSYSDETKSVLAELEKDYGPFQHAKVIVYGSGSGGMEYSGATVTDLSAVGHELFHSYNARAVMPSQGNAGWIDEAMSSWRDNHYNKNVYPGGMTKMAGHSKWVRKTDTDAYSKGASFLAWIAGRMDKNGQDLKAFLREYFKDHFYTTVTTQDLETSLEKYSGMDLSTDFAAYIYGTAKRKTGTTWGHGEKACTAPAAAEVSIPNPFHPKLTKAQRDALLWP